MFFWISRSVVSRDMVEEERDIIVFWKWEERVAVWGCERGLLMKGMVFSVGGCYRKIVKRVPTLVDIESEFARGFRSMVSAEKRKGSVKVDREEKLNS